MKRYNFIIVMLMAFTLPCLGHSDKTVDLELTIYPSSGGEFGYVIKVKGLALKVFSKELEIDKGEIVLGKTKEVEERELSKCQISKIKRYLKEIEDLGGKYEELELILDVWVFDFFINGKQSIKINSSLLKESQKFKKTEKLVEYLKRLSPMEIKLKGFS